MLLNNKHFARKREGSLHLVIDRIFNVACNHIIKQVVQPTIVTMQEDNIPVCNRLTRLILVYDTLPCSSMKLNTQVIDIERAVCGRKVKVPLTVRANRDADAQ